VILIDLNELHGETTKLSLLLEYLDKVLKLAGKETTR